MQAVDIAAERRFPEELAKRMELLEIIAPQTFQP
jgi:hypothetical protein